MPPTKRVKNPATMQSTPAMSAMMPPACFIHDFFPDVWADWQNLALRDQTFIETFNHLGITGGGRTLVS